MLHRFTIVFLMCVMGASWAKAEDAFDFAEKRFYSKGESIAMSALVPGLGQIATDHKLKGGMFLLTYATSVVVALNAHENYKARLGDYRRSTDEYEALLLGGTYEEAEQKWKQLEEDNGELDRLHRARVLFSVAAAAIYAYNLVDALFLTSYESPPKRVSLGVKISHTPYLTLSVAM